MVNQDQSTIIYVDSAEPRPLTGSPPRREPAANQERTTLPLQICLDERKFEPARGVKSIKPLPESESQHV